jgi:hypothetical protein
MLDLLNYDIFIELDWLLDLVTFTMEKLAPLIILL